MCTQLHDLEKSKYQLMTNKIWNILDFDPWADIISPYFPNCFELTEKYAVAQFASTK